MLKKSDILKLFDLLNIELAKRGQKGEIGIVGGAVMCLVYNARAATKDVDAIFEPSALIRKLAKEIGTRENLPPDWLNDAAKGFIMPGFKEEEVLCLSHLRVWAPEARYMLAMKCLSARWDSNDRDDVIFLIKKLKFKNAKQVFDLIEHFYPRKQIPAKTQFFIEELYEDNV